MLERHGIRREDCVSFEVAKQIAHKPEFRVLMAQLEMQFADIEMIYRVAESDDSEPDKVSVMDFLATVVLSSGKARSDTILRIPLGSQHFRLAMQLDRSH